MAWREFKPDLPSTRSPTITYDPAENSLVDGSWSASVTATDPDSTLTPHRKPSPPTAR